MVLYSSALLSTVATSYLSIKIHVYTTVWYQSTGRGGVRVSDRFGSPTAGPDRRGVGGEVNHTSPPATATTAEFFENENNNSLTLAPTGVV